MNILRSNKVAALSLVLLLSNAPVFSMERGWGESAKGLYNAAFQTAQNLWANRPAMPAVSLPSVETIKEAIQEHPYVAAAIAVPVVAGTSYMVAKKIKNKKAVKTPKIEQPESQAALPADNMLFWYVAGDMADQKPVVIKESEEDFGTAELFKDQEPVKQAAIEPIEPKKADALVNDRGLDKTFRGPKIEQTLQAVVLKPKAKPAAPKAPAPTATITPAQLSQRVMKKPAPALKPVVATAPTQKEAAQAQAKALAVAAQAQVPALKPAAPKSAARTTLPVAQINEVDRAINELEKLVERTLASKELTDVQKATLDREVLRCKNLCRDSKATPKQVAKIQEYLETLELIKENRK